MEMFLYAAGFGALVLLTVEDIKSLKLSMPVLGLMCLMTLVVRLIFKERIWSVLLSFSPGLLMIFISVVTGGAIGLGDGFAVMMVGGCLGFSSAVCVVGLSFMILSLSALVLILIKKAGRKTILPYMPWLLIAYILGGIFK